LAFANEKKTKIWQNGAQGARFAREIGPLSNRTCGPYGLEHSSVVQEVPFAPDPGVTSRVIPLLSWAQAGTAQAWNDLDAREGFVGFNVRDPKAVAVQIRGDGMAPPFPPGTIAVVYPGCEAKSGDLVIARLKDGTLLFTRFHVDGNHYTFISLNPIYPPRTVEKSRVERVLPVGITFQTHL
jgi:SOS-response transcriptional repressor LexA